MVDRLDLAERQIPQAAIAAIEQEATERLPAVYAHQQPAKASAALASQGVADKNELLFQHGVNFNDLPLWQRRGTGLYWESYEREGYNPKLDQQVVTTRRRIKVNQELSMGEEYVTFIGRLMRTGPLPSTPETGTDSRHGDP